MGYEHVIEWLSSNVARPSSASDVSKDEQSDDEDADELADPDRIETSGDIISVPEIDEHQIDQVKFFSFSEKKNSPCSLFRVLNLVMKSKVITMVVS